ncbi:hypothetical protein ABZ807_20970 [Micromonospora sp. NPDC047548]|uniref:hypothetical protein n=1 Tax=Micromonospora sp. NPDC047548 TaxID=3155624 RepID=UPI0033E32493
MFSHITMNWQGRPLTSREVIGPVPATGGTRARLMLGEHVIGCVSSSVSFSPSFGSGIDTSDLAWYAADCRTDAEQTRCADGLRRRHDPLTAGPTWADEVFGKGSL